MPLPMMPGIRAREGWLLPLVLVSLGLPGCASSPRGNTESRPPAPSPGGFSASERDRIAACAPQVRRAAKTYGVDPALVGAVIWVESRFNPDARGPGGAKGLMQLMPPTSRELAAQLSEKNRPLDPEFNVKAGTFYLAKMLRRYTGDETLAVAAYNAGPGNADRFAKAKRLPPANRSYVDKVMAARARLEPLLR